jgi:hypothetical protein
MSTLAACVAVEIRTAVKNAIDVDFTATLLAGGVT